MSTGSILRRTTKAGEPRFLIKYDLPPGPDGKRRQGYKSFKTERDAAKGLRAAMKAIDDNEHVDTTKATLSDWLDQWIEQHRPRVTAKTMERYEQVLRHVRRELGATRLQALTATQFETLYAKLQTGGLSAQSALHVHRVMRLAMAAAVRQRRVVRDVLDDVTAPRVKAKKLEVLSAADLRRLLTGLRTSGHGGKPGALYPLAVLAAGSGMRRGELCALRWREVDLDAGRVTVSRSVEHTKAHGQRIKGPKSAAGHRSIDLPAGVVTKLRAERARQRETYLAAGVRLTDDALVFGSPDDPMHPRYVSALSRQFSETARRLGFPSIGLHSLRHAHASMLIKGQTSMKVVQERLGHSDVRTTMGIYVHSLPDQDSEAAALTGKLLGDALG